MNQQEINQIIQIKTFDEMSEKEVEDYAQIFLEKIEEQYDQFELSRNFWCPKCESPDAEVEVDDEGVKGLATCPNCKMAVVMVSSDFDIEDES